MQTLLFDHALLPHGWAEHVAVHIDEAGTIAEVTIDATEGERIAGCLLPASSVAEPVPDCPGLDPG